ncbi:MAG TPA: prepilin-type N-terminal cleavage/methylation domain-containing protein [Gemmataceae bacterium]|nr:prepilin-type N-terminal cleavage/methylation domain-containing protein [Gemmataceae bacterium]
MHRTTAGRRPGFTLVELLVVIGIILVVAALALLLIPRFQDKQKASLGADKVQQHLLTAKMTALRDRRPSGIRLVVGADGYARTLQYIQLPDDFKGGTLAPDPNNPNQVVIQDPTGVTDVTGGLAEQPLWPVQPGDYLFLNGGSTPYLITGVNAGNVLQVQPSPWTNGVPPAPTVNYSIARSPRPMAGIEDVQLPQDVVVDFTVYPLTGAPRSLMQPETRPDGSLAYDILFAPDGSVLRRAGASGKIVLWIRDVSRDDAEPGHQTLITVFTRTGLIAAQLVDTGSPNPYSFTADPRASGL